MRARFETVKRLEAAPRRSSLKKVTLSNFTKFRRKQLRQSFFIDKVEDWKPATLSITASRTGIFLWILQNFQQHIFWRTPTDGCLKNKQLKVFIHSLAKLLYAWSQAKHCTWKYLKMFWKKKQNFKGIWAVLGHLKPKIFSIGLPVGDSFSRPWPLQLF